MARLNPTALTRHRPRPESRFRKSSLVFDLWRETNELKLEKAWRLHGRNAKTLAKRSDGTLILEIVTKGKLVLPHAAPASLQVHVLAGRLRIHLLDREVDLVAGHSLWLEPHLPYGIEALDDTSYTVFVCGHPTATDGPHRVTAKGRPARS
jgi:hypothetical protein